MMKKDYEVGMSEQEHTPGPWKSVISEHTSEPVVREPQGETVAVCCEILEGEAEANAAFIVKACNSHDELLSAAETAAEIIRGSYGQEDSLLPCDCQAVNVLERAIRKAKEEEV